MTATSTQALRDFDGLTIGSKSLTRSARNFVCGADTESYTIKRAEGILVLIDVREERDASLIKDAFFGLA